MLPRTACSRPDGSPDTYLIRTVQLQPEVLPQPSQTKQDPAGRILVPQVKHIGASAVRPCRASNSSAEECTLAGAALAVAAPVTPRAVPAGALPPVLAVGLATGVEWFDAPDGTDGADRASDSSSSSTPSPCWSSSGRYEPVSSSRARSAAL